MAQKTNGAIIESNDFAPVNPQRPSSTSNGPTNEPELIAGYETIDPADIGNRDTSDSGGSGTGKRRGRKPGSRNAPKTVPQNLAGLESVLLSIHLMGASILQTPELALDPKEAKDLSEATKRLNEFYPVIIDPKKFAWFNFIMVAGAIYGPRIIAIRNRHASEAAKKPAQPRVIQMQPPAPAPAPASKPNGAAQPSKPQGMYPSQIFGAGGVGPVDDIQ